MYDGGWWQVRQGQHDGVNEGGSVSWWQAQVLQGQAVESPNAAEAEGEGTQSKLGSVKGLVKEFGVTEYERGSAPEVKVNKLSAEVTSLKDSLYAMRASSSAGVIDEDVPTEHLSHIGCSDDLTGLDANDHNSVDDEDGRFSRIGCLGNLTGLNAGQMLAKDGSLGKKIKVKEEKDSWLALCAARKCEVTSKYCFGCGFGLTYGEVVGHGGGNGFRGECDEQKAWVWQAHSSCYVCGGGGNWFLANFDEVNSWVRQAHSSSGGIDHETGV